MMVTVYLFQGEAVPDNVRLRNPMSLGSGTVALTANALDFQLAADSPALGQVHGLSAAALSLQAVALGNPLLTVPVALGAVGIDFGPLALGNPALGQVHSLAAGNVAFQAFDLGNPVLVGDDMAVTSASSGGVYKLTAAADAITGTIRVRRVRWVGATTAAHVLEIRTGSAGVNDVVYSSIATGANFLSESVFDPPLSLAGLTVQTLGSGTVYIYV